jgi:hypothetical protein
MGALVLRTARQFGQTTSREHLTIPSLLSLFFCKKNLDENFQHRNQKINQLSLVTLDRNWLW